MWTVVKVLAILVTGPVLAFGVLAIGCNGASPALGTLCGHNSLLSLVVLTLAAWCILATVNVGVSALRGK